MKKRKRNKIANKPRFVLFCTLCALLMLVGVNTISNASSDRETYTLCVASGDTLWEIARSNNTSGKDLRRVVDDIMKLNNMSNTNLQVGDTLEIPIY